LIAVDTNLLVYAHRSAVQQHAAARASIERAARDPRGWGVPAPCLAEFWMVVTHPAASGRPSTPAEALAFIEALRESGRMQVMEVREGMASRLIGLAERLHLRGPRIFDLQIGLCALEAGATELWSHDRGFIAPAGLRIVDPLAGP
jgi:toxin-antitoxin system PIN domain toxin